MTKMTTAPVKLVTSKRTTKRKTMKQVYHYNMSDFKAKNKKFNPDTCEIEVDEALKKKTITTSRVNKKRCIQWRKKNKKAKPEHRSAGYLNYANRSQKGRYQKRKELNEAKARAPLEQRIRELEAAAIKKEKERTKHKEKLEKRATCLEEKLAAAERNVKQEQDYRFAQNK